MISVKKKLFLNTGKILHMTEVFDAHGSSTVIYSQRVMSLRLSHTACIVFPLSFKCLDL